MLHSGIVAAAVYGWFTWKTRSPPPVTLAIEGTVVDARALKAPPPPKPEPAPPEPEPVPEPEPEEQGPPKPDPAEIERKKEEERLAAEKLEQEQQLKEQQEKERLDTEKKEAQRQAAAEKAAAEKKAADKKKADEAAATKKAADEKARLAREAELKRAMEAEERGNAVRNSDEAQRWYASIVAKIERAWIKPASAQPGVTCIVDVSQVRGGDVTKVRVKSCSINDPALMQSVENAVYSASPLPNPPDMALFESNLELTFAPTK